MGFNAGSVSLVLMFSFSSEELAEVLMNSLSRLYERFNVFSIKFLTFQPLPYGFFLYLSS